MKLLRTLLLSGGHSRPGALPLGLLFVTLAVMGFIAHGGDPFPREELALVYGLGYLALLVGGGGSFSVMKFFKRCPFSMASPGFFLHSTRQIGRKTRIDPGNPHTRPRQGS